MQRDREPESGPPPFIVRAGFHWGMPFAIIWAIGGFIIWNAVLAQFGTTWPSILHEPWITLAVTVLSAIFGVLCGVGMRLLLWVASERRIKHQPIRPPKVRREIKISQQWNDV
jgi:hypothetical protein